MERYIKQLAFYFEFLANLTGDLRYKIVGAFLDIEYIPVLVIDPVKIHKAYRHHKANNNPLADDIRQVIEKGLIGNELEHYVTNEPHHTTIHDDDDLNASASYWSVEKPLLKISSADKHFCFYMQPDDDRVQYSEDGIITYLEGIDWFVACMKHANFTEFFDEVDETILWYCSERFDQVRSMHYYDTDPQHEHIYNQLVNLLDTPPRLDVYD